MGSPDSWKHTKLEGLAVTFSGGTPSRANPAYYAGKIPWVKSGEVNLRTVRSTQECISDAALENSSTRVAPKGSVLVAMYGATAGKVAMLEIDAAINQAILAIVPKERIADGRYLLYSLEHETPLILRKVQGSGQPNLSGSILRGHHVLVPPLGEQKKIAAILSSVDEAIEATQAVIEQLQIVKKAMMAELLTRGLPGRHTRFKQTEIGEVPEEWEVVPLSEVAFVQTGIAKGKVIEAGVELPYLRVANVQDGRVDLTEMKTILVEERSVPRYSLTSGDVLFTEGGDADKLGRGCVWRGQIAPCLHQNHVFAVRTNQERLTPEYLSYWAASPRGKGYFLDSAKQTTNLASINSTQLKAFPVPLAPLEEQQSIVRSLTAIEERAACEQAVASQLRTSKAALMAVLLTGEVRVKPDDEAA